MIRQLITTWRRTRELKRFHARLNELAAVWAHEWTDSEARLLEWVYDYVERWAEEQREKPASGVKAAIFDRRLERTSLGRALLAHAGGSWKLRQAREDTCLAVHRVRCGKAPRVR